MKIYKHPTVAAVRSLHETIIVRRNAYATLHEQLDAFARNLAKAYQAGDERAVIEIKNALPGSGKSTAEEVLQAGLSEEDFRQCIAAEYGFENWAAVESEGKVALNEDFETAVDLLLTGEKTKLKTLLRKQPELAQQQSQYGHRAGLIHYLAANGVEIWRQIVPENAPELAKLLLETGANLEQEHNIYGGQGDVLELIESSGHPFAAGVGEELVQVLKEK